MNRWLVITAAALLLSGCATTFTLGHIAPAPDHTVAQQQLDILTCKDQAAARAGGAGPQAAGFLLGLTVVGLPAARGMDREIQRTEFASCMAAKGYTVS
jgi:uncharacterized protein YceK